jgi:hypothetical protein
MTLLRRMNHSRLWSQY